MIEGLDLIFLGLACLAIAVFSTGSMTVADLVLLVLSLITIIAGIAEVWQWAMLRRLLEKDKEEAYSHGK